MHSPARRRLLVSLPVLIVSALIAACGGDSTSAPADDGPFTGTIHVRDNNFSPASVTITEGESVTWRWEGSHAHSVEEGTSLTNPTPDFDSGTKTTGTFSHTFTTVETVHYFCRPHFSAGMKGTITVKAATP